MSLKAGLITIFEPWELNLTPQSYDIIGDIGVIRVPTIIEHRTQEIAKAVMQANKHVKTVLRQMSPVSGDLRLRKLTWVSGERRTKTVHKEASCVFRVDLKKSYFSPRLSHERLRVASKVRAGEIVVNMFAGVGCFSILIAKKTRAEKVYSIDINPNAVQYTQENIRLNKVANVVEPIEGDARHIIEERLRNIADRVLMPLPEKAYEYLDYAVMALKPEGGMIHYYDFVHADRDEKPIEKVTLKVSNKLISINVGFQIPFGRIVRTVGPRWYQVVLDILVYKKPLYE